MINLQFSDKDLEIIYRQANNIPQGKRAHLTTEAVFKAMREVVKVVQETLKGENNE